MNRKTQERSDVIKSRFLKTIHYMRLNSITTDSEKVQLGAITIFVGANNSGKSQTLRDIREKMTNSGINPVIIRDFDFEIPDTIDVLLDGIGREKSSLSTEHIRISGVGANLLSPEMVDIHLPSLENDIKTNKHSVLTNIGKFRIANLDSSTRLNLISTSSSFNPNTASPSNLLQSLYKDRQNERIMQDAFKEAFDMDIKLDYSELMSFCLRIAKELPIIPEDPRNASLITQSLQKIDMQGDGFKSFAGIILGLLFSVDKIVLLDEPEAFLHPAQARFLGKWIVDNSELFRGQLLISTHSSNFLNGVLSGSKQVDIYRLNRQNNVTEYNLLPPSAIDKLTKHPVLSSQRVVDAIFYKGVVVCEADSDRAIYQSVASINHHSNQEVLFIHAHNKQTLRIIAKLLKESKIPTVTIADIDILNSKKDFTDLVEALTTKSIKSYLMEMRNNIADAIAEINNESKLFEQAKDTLANLLQRINNDNKLTLSEIKSECNNLKKALTSWKEIKNKGIEGFAGENKVTASELINKVKEYGLFIAPVGELEGWMNLGVKQKNRWITEALTEVYEGNASKELIFFVKEVLCFFEK